MPRENKNYELKSARRPAQNSLLITTVGILGKDLLRYYCYVSFSDKLTEAVGRRLPRGLSQNEPGFLYVVETAKGFQIHAKTWSGESVLMWEQPDQPAWLKFIKAR